MILNIHDHQTVADLQERFSECFPHLKIEFYKKAFHSNKPLSANDIIIGEVPIGAFRENHNPGQLEIKSFYQAGKVLSDLRGMFGLYAQIFRKQEGQWVKAKSIETLGFNNQTASASAVVKEPVTEVPNEIYENYNAYTL